MTGYRNFSVISGYFLSGALILLGVLQSLTFNMYHIYSHMVDFSPLLIATELIKISAYLVVPLAIFLRHKTSRNILKLVFAVVPLLSFSCIGEYSSMVKTALNSPNTNNLDQVTLQIYDSINLFMPRSAIFAMFALTDFILLSLAILVFLEDGLDKKDCKSLLYYPIYILCCLPLNIFAELAPLLSERVLKFTIFENFSFWHFLMFALLVFFTLLAYFILRKKDAEKQVFYLRAMSVILMIHFASKDSMLIGDGYNIYNIVLSAIPLFICDIGKFIVLLAVWTRKKVFFDMGFFVHAVGALTVFFYMGKDQNFGPVFCYSFLYFTSTHLLLFMLSVLPVMLGLTSFHLKDCIIPAAYYACVIVVATITSVIITNLSSTWATPSGEHLSGLLYLNFAFTQICPIPLEFPTFLNVKIGQCEVNFVYVISLYLSYLGLFIAFFLLQLGVRKAAEFIKARRA